MSNTFTYYLIYSVLFILLLSDGILSTNTVGNVNIHKIEGKIVFPPGLKAIDHTRILVNEGEFVGIPHPDGSFVIAGQLFRKTNTKINNLLFLLGIPSGSYIVSVSSPRLIFPPVRVDITKNGKIRARKLNLVEPREVILVRYPLHFETYQIPRYFKKREVFHFSDILLNPIFSTLIMFILAIVFLPKMTPNMQEMQDAQQQLNNVFRPDINLPDLTDIFIRLFGGVIRRARRN